LTGSVAKIVIDSYGQKVTFTYAVTDDGRQMVEVMIAIPGDPDRVMSAQFIGSGKIALVEDAFDNMLIDGKREVGRPKRGPKPRVTFDGRTYVCKSYSVVVPDLAEMARFEALIWISNNTYPTGYSRVTNPLAGLRGVISIG
jgi:hypothetical protein